MNVIKDESVLKNFDGILNELCNSHEPIVITRELGNSVVLMSLEDFNSLEETAYLLRSPRNAKRLFDAIWLTLK